MFEGKYTEIPNSPSIPLINLRIRQSEPMTLIVSQGVLDTGSDCTLVPFSIIFQCKQLN